MDRSSFSLLLTTFMLLYLTGRAEEARLMFGLLSEIFGLLTLYLLTKKLYLLLSCVLDLSLFASYFLRLKYSSS